MAYAKNVKDMYHGEFFFKSITNYWPIRKNEEFVLDII